MNDTKEASLLLMLLMMIYEFLLRAREQSCLYRTLSVVASQVKQKIQKIQTAAASHSKRGFLFMVMT
jgi:hypothetical protein